MESERNQNGVKINELPTWLKNISLNNAVAAIVGPFEKVNQIHIDFDHANNNDGLLRYLITVNVLLDEGKTTEVHFSLTTVPEEEPAANLVNGMQLLSREETMYDKIIPKFEQLYYDIGKKVKFAPRPFKFDTEPSLAYVLVENVMLHDFKRAPQAAALDVQHMEEALKKLAQFHAASACYVEHFRMYGNEFCVGIFTKSNRKLLAEINSSTIFLNQLKNWKNGQKYYKKLADCEKILVDRLLQDQKINPREFNVLNHGDCWSKNILFQYDVSGKISQSLFLDFQMAKYGSPVNDLFYLILTSAAMNIKLTHFDYLIWFYYHNLTENLKLLQYTRPLPKLRSLQLALLNNGLAAYLVVSKVLPVVMWDRRPEVQKQDADQLKMAMVSSPRYVHAVSQIMQWLELRGLLDWK